MQNKLYFFFKQGFPKGGGGGPTFGENSQKIPFFGGGGVPKGYRSTSTVLDTDDDSDDDTDE